jgi:2,5-diketo-D-gluconate reductase A
MDGAVTADGRGRTLADGAVMPLLGLGVWQGPGGRDCVRSVRWALELGYRHIDTAQAYGNEASVGRALRESGLAREELFLTTKSNPARADPLREIAHSIERLGGDYVDLYLVHWPQDGPTRAWPEMERARERSYTRSIGVSNFSVAELDRVIDVASSAPVVDQVQFNPFAYRQALLRACTRRSIALLEATGETARARSVDSPDQLTDAGSGLTMS